MKKNTIQAKRQRTKGGKVTPLNVSTMQCDDKPNNDVSNEIHIGGQLGIPEKTQVPKNKKRRKPLTGIDLLNKRITFADIRKQSQKLNLIKTHT